MDRRGQKTGAGYYDYDENRNAKPVPVTEKIIHDFAAKTGVNPRKISDEEILERCIYPMINEGAKILEEGKAHPRLRHRCGLGQRLRLAGLSRRPDVLRRPDRARDKVLEPMQEFEAEMGDEFKPAALLEKLVAEGKTFRDL